MPSIPTETNPVDTPPAALPRLHQLAMPSRLTVVLMSLLLATPAVIFWLWLVIVPARVVILCPEECECDTAGFEVKCYGTSLNSLPLIRFPYVQGLYLNVYNISVLNKDSFVSLADLEELSIYKFGLRTIDLGAFNGLTDLTELLITDNDISEIIPGTFDNMNSLELLVLKDNRLEHLDKDVFSGLVKLKYLDLKRNKLQYLHPDTFLGLPVIQLVSLYNNQGLQIPTDHNFINSHSLSYLDISLCNVSSVSVETFANVSALEWLDLRYNYLMTVDINIFRALSKLSKFYFFGNPLQCDCQLQEVWLWCKDHNIRTETGYRRPWGGYEDAPPKCDTPTEVKGMWWGVLEKGRCIEGNVQYYGDYKNSKFTYRDYDGFVLDYNYFFFEQYEVPLYAVPFIFGTIGNVILLIIIICNKDMRTVPNMYILSLAISDIIYVTILFSEACARKRSDTWLDGVLMCTFLPFFRRLSVGLSAYSVAVYSFQRYRITVKPFHARLSSPPTWRVTVASICGVWIVAALFAVPSALSKYLCGRIFLSKSIKYYQIVVIFELLVSCVLPLCVVAFSYVMTARHLVESSRFLTEGRENPQLKIRRNAAKTVVGLAIVFIISYVPYHAFWTYFIYSEKDKKSSEIRKILSFSNYRLQYTYLISTGLFLINPCFNPVALFFTSSPFRRHLRRYLTCFCKTNSPPTDVELRRRN